MKPILFVHLLVDTTIRSTTIQHLYPQAIYPLLLTVFTTSSYALPPILPQPAIAIDSTTISQLDVLKALQSLDTSKSTGIDGIGPKLLKSRAVEYMFQFTIFFL